jgi:Zn-dependent M28 family amino/carboxypeptidase
VRLALVLFFLTPLAQAGEPLIASADLEIASQLADQALTSDAAWNLLESLTTEVGPRMAGSDGDARAVAWGEAKFSELGFDRVWKEPVTFPRWVRGEEHASVISPYPQPLSITALGGSEGTGAGGIEAPIAHFETMEELGAAAPGSLDGKIAFVSNIMQRAHNGAGYGPAVAARRNGASVAASKGALAVLIRSVGTDQNRTPHTGLMRYADDQPRIPAAALSAPDSDLLVNMLKRDQPVTVKLSLGAHYQGEATSYNVIGEITGRERPQELVVVGCHLDSWDLGTGAIDDGAGCALTMAAAVNVANHQDGPSRTVRVVLWANEEQGLIGANAYAEAHQDDLENHIIGSESDFGAGRIYRFSSRVKPEALGMIDQINQVLSPLGVARGDNLARGGPDLIPMHKRGMAMVSLSQDGTDYFDYHHTANDTLDKVDPESLQQCLAVWTAFIWLAAQAPGDFGFGLGLDSDQ